jgi:predicted ATP-grasp superfamily ATP-dependent carboligase
VGKLIWTGVRESDIRDARSFFDGSITIFGTNDKKYNYSYCTEKGIRLNHNVCSPEASDFILHKQLEMIEADSSIRFMAYNSNVVYGADERVVSRMICLNKEPLMERLNDKIQFREWAERLNISLMDYDIVDKHTIDDLIKEKYPNVDIVVQHPTSSGGEGTFRVSGDDDVKPYISDNQNYIITKYAEHGIPINTHCVIYKDGFLIFPPSIQIVTEVEKRLLYRGADFIEYNKLPEQIDTIFKSYVSTMCTQLMHDGYLGVIGFDAILSNDTVYLQEINNRFQGSTYPLNRAMFENGLPSIQQLNYEAFKGHECPSNKQEIERLSVPYSYYVFANDRTPKHAEFLYQRIKSGKISEVVSCEGDGISFTGEISQHAVMYQVMFNTNISSVRYNEPLYIQPDLTIPSEEWFCTVKRDLTALKTSLINEGVVLSIEAEQYLLSKYGLKKGNYYSIDLELSNGHYANCPVANTFCLLSPFELQYSDENGLLLTYYGEILSKTAYIPHLQTPLRHTSSGSSIDDIVYFATDRLRLQNSPICLYGSSDKHACRFCEVYGTKSSFTEEDILESIDICFKNADLSFRHVLIGGRSNYMGNERDVILRMCERIRRYSDMSIYLMCLPPSNLSDIDTYHSAGVTEFGFNIEIYDRNLSSLYMPGKGSIPLEQYLDALGYAASICEQPGAVRSAFIAGLEPSGSLLEGIKAVCDVGAAPVLSAFRPIPGTPMQNVIKPSSEWLHKVVLEAEKKCIEYGVTLGPECVACQNNTLNVII